MSALAAGIGITLLLCWVAPGRLAAGRVRQLRRPPALPPPLRRGGARFRWPGRGARRRARELRAGVAVAADLLAACLQAGAGPTDAADAVGAALGGPVGAELCRVAALIRLGADAADTWRELGTGLAQGGADTSGLCRLGRALGRAAESGTGAAAAAAAEATLVRRDREAHAQAMLARVGVWAAAPLGLCFLPAFVCLGVAPMIIDLAAAVLGARGGASGP